MAVLALVAASEIPAIGTWAARWRDLAEVTTARKSPESLWQLQYPVAVFVWWELGRRIRAETSADDSVFVWGYEPLVYVESQRRAPTRFAVIGPLVVPWADPAWRAELMSDLRREPPSHFIVCRNDAMPAVTGIWADSATLLPRFGYGGVR